jgi:hypothetical protein
MVENDREMVVSPEMPLWRQVARKIVSPVRKARCWWRGLWNDLIPYLLALTGYVPSHGFRKFVYRAFGVKISQTSSIHSRTRFSNPQALSIGEHTVISVIALSMHVRVSLWFMRQYSICSLYIYHGTRY